MRPTPFLLVATLLVAPAVPAGDAVRIVEDAGRWESGYGEEFYNVVGRVENGGDAPVAYVKLRIDAIDDAGKVVASTDAFNESAEGLSVPGLDDAARTAIVAKLKPLAPGATERFRGSFLKDETPPLAGHRVRVVEAPARR